MNQSTHTAVERLRRIASGIETPEDRAWQAERVSLYLRQAPKGLSLEDALDLAPSCGTDTWWRAEARARRDDALRALAKLFYPGLSISQQAASIQTIASHYESTAWLIDRRRDSMPEAYRGGPKALLFVALATGVPMPQSLRQLRNILSNFDKETPKTISLPER